LPRRFIAYALAAPRNDMEDIEKRKGPPENRGRAPKACAAGRFFRLDLLVIDFFFWHS